MGKQIEFFISIDDIENIFRFIKQREDRILSKKVEIVSDLSNQFKNEYFDSEIGFQLYIWKNGFKIEKHHDIFLESSNSEVIEFLSGGGNRDKKEIYPGRFWVEMNGLRDETYFRKTEELDKLYGVYKKYIIKNFRKSKDKFVCYIGPEAYELYKKGWKMMQNPRVEMHFD